MNSAAAAAEDDTTSRLRAGPVLLQRARGAKHGLPLVMAPGFLKDAGKLGAWLKSEPTWVRGVLRRHGAILFRGFGVTTPQQFEALARAVDDELKNDYLGTSPRSALTDYVFSASELPGYYPIPQHCEMSFTANPPRRVFFWCSVAPSGRGGETPLVDFARVWARLDPEVRARFQKLGIRAIRNYSGPGKGGRDLLQLKRWDEMFRTTDKQAVEARARAEGFQPSWQAGDRLTLVSEHRAMRPHPETREQVWFNHSQVFHLSSGPAELGRVFRLRPNLRVLGAWLLARALVSRKRRLPAHEQAMHCTYGNGAEIPDADMDHVRDVIWQNLVVVPWEAGDVVAIDNFRIGHGRLPYRGRRQVAVCWA